MTATAPVIETARLRLRPLHLDDAAFILRLLNEPSWLANIGDRGVRTLDDAGAYLRDGPLALYAKHGFGLLAVELRDSGAVAGLCGLLKRDALPHPDIGFAFLPEHWRQGYARESARAVLDWARDSPGLRRVLAIVAPHNRASAQLLEQLGFRRDGTVRLKPDAEVLDLYAAG